MKIKFKSAWHRKTFTEFITANVKKARGALTGYSVNLKNLDIAGISTEGYALFTAAKAVYHGSVDISLHELCDANLIDDSTVMTIFAGVMLFRNGIGLLNWRF